MIPYSNDFIESEHHEKCHNGMHDDNVNNAEADNDDSSSSSASESSSSSSCDDSDTSLSSESSQKLKEGNDYGFKNKSFLKILKKASKSKYSPMIISEEMNHSLEIIDHPPADKKSFLFGIILMFIAAFLFSISTTIIKWNHSFGRESFEIFVFRMFIQLFVTTVVASISVVMNRHYCYESVDAFSTYEYDTNEGTETEIESDAELGENINPLNKMRRKHRNRNAKISKLRSFIGGKYKFDKPCCQIRCVYTTIFSEFWKECSSETKWYIFARGVCGGTGAVCYYWAVAILPINDTITILSLFPVFSTIFSALILKERISVKHMTALFISMCGILLMCYPSFLFGRDDRDDAIYNLHETEWKLLIQGYGYALVASICYGFVFVFIRLAYKAPTFALIFSNGLFGLIEAIIICSIFHMFVPIPMWRDWVIAIGIGLIGYLAQNTENTSGKYIFASLSSLIRVTEVFWEYVWQNMIYAKSAGLVASIGAGCLAFSIIVIIFDKYNDIQSMQISAAKEGELQDEYETDSEDIANHNYVAKYNVKIGAQIASKICRSKYKKVNKYDSGKEID